MRQKFAVYKHSSASFKERSLLKRNRCFRQITSETSTMPIDTVEIINCVSRLSEEERLRVTVNQSLKGGFIAGGMAVVGGLLGGPAGIAFGGTVGSCVGAAMARDFKPVHEVIATMDQEKKDALAENVRRIMANVDVTDVAMLGVLLAGDLSLKNKVIYALVDFFKNELSMAIADH